jgi:hypothetical protein
MQGIYDSSLDNIFTDTTALNAHLDWVQKNKINPLGWDYNTLYISDSKINDPKFPDAVLNCYLRKIKVGVAWSAPSQITNSIAYNARQTDVRKKLHHMKTELETYGSSPNCTVAQYRSWVKDNYDKIRNAGMLSWIYDSWNHNYDISVPYSDGLFTTAYRPSANMVNTDDCYNYVDDRLIEIVGVAKSLGKIVESAILTSSESNMGQTFFKTNPWDKQTTMFVSSFGRKATSDMKKYLNIGFTKVFKADVMKVSKP